MRKELLLLALFAGCSKAPPPPPPEPPYVTVVEAVCQDAPIYLEYVGHVEAFQAVDIKAQVAGTLVGQYFAEGQEVQEGDLLLKIDERPFLAALAKAEGELAQNLATLRQAKDTAERYALLVKDEYISQLDYDQFVTNVLSSEAAVKQSQADVETARINLDYCSVRSPLNGVTSNLLINVGNYVPVGGNHSLLSINQVTPIKVSFYVPEKDLPRIQAAQDTEPLKAIAYVLGTPVEGDLYLINNQVDENTGMLLLQAIYQNQDKKLWPGQFVDVRLVLKIQKNATLVPSQAVQIGQEGPYLYVMKPDYTVELRQVTVGQKEDEWTVIEEGLKPQEVVVLDGQVNLKPGIHVAKKSGG